MIKLIIKALRLHQWVKNTLIFIPLLLAHRVSSLDLWKTEIVAFFAFSLCASAVYVINDLIDIESDRQHRYKKNRPFASGALSPRIGIIIAPILFTLGGLLGGTIGQNFLAVLASYVILTSIYSLKAKKIVLVDIIMLASLYTIRLVAGAVATDVMVSQWLIAFSMFLFFSLACVKRFSELWLVRQKDEAKAGGRGYLTVDLECISQFGISSGCISILVLALYVNSNEVSSLYSRPFLLWGICPLLFYWLSRVWLLTSRGRMHDDPIVFALEDSTSYAIGVLLMLCVYFAI